MKKKIDIISGTETAYTMTESERLDYEELKDFYKEQREQTQRKQMPVYSGVLKYFPDAIREVSKRLLQIERIVNRNIKLKTEAGVDGTQYWKSTRKNLGKISERMNRISARLRNLSS